MIYQNIVPLGIFLSITSISNWEKTTLKDLYINFEKLLVLIIVILHLPQVFLSGKSKHTVKSQETKIREEKKLLVKNKHKVISGSYVLITVESSSC